jgi:hypothetical protein
MKDYGAIMLGHAYGILEQVFNAEWVKLDAEGRKLVAQDFLEASEHEVTAREYARRIGAGNLEAYAATMKVRFRLGWDSK